MLFFQYAFVKMHLQAQKIGKKVQWWRSFFTPKNTKTLQNQGHQRNSIKSRHKAWMESAACLRYGIKAKPCMESSQSGVWNQSEGGYTLARDAIPSHCDGFHTPCGWFHANPSDWIEKSKSFDLLFSWFDPTISNPNPNEKPYISFPSLFH